jgi:predicted dehydrogenase
MGDKKNTKAENVRELLRQQWEHARHMEMERAYLMMAYGAMLAVFLAFGKDGTPLINITTNGVFIFLLVVTFFCFFQTTRWTYAFECHRQKANIFAKILWAETGYDTEVDATFNISSMQTVPTIKFWKINSNRISKWINNRTKTRYLYPAFYFAFLIIFSILSFANLAVSNTNQSPSSIVMINLITSVSNTNQTAPFFVSRLFQLTAYPWACVNQWTAIFIMGLAIISGSSWYVALKNVDRNKIVVLEGGNGDWAQKQYLPVLLDKIHDDFNILKFKLFVVDISNKITITSNEVFEKWCEANKKDEAGYINKKNQTREYKALMKSDVVFIVSPPKYHLEIAEFWLPRLTSNGKIYIEKPLDASLDAANVFGDKLTKKKIKNVLFGYDHYLARVYPFIKEKDAIIHKIDGIKCIEFRTLEDYKIPEFRASTLNDGLINDLFCHVLTVVCATILEKTNTFAETIKKTQIKRVRVARYKDAPIKGETFAWIDFEVQGIAVQAVIGKCARDSLDIMNVENQKSMKLIGNKGSVILDLYNNNYRVTTHDNTTIKPKDLNNEPVKTFINKILDGTKPDMVPGVLSFDESMEILKKLEETNRSITKPMAEYQIKNTLAEIKELLNIKE